MDLAYLNEVLTIEGSQMLNASTTITKLAHHIHSLKRDVKVIVEDSALQFTTVEKENNRLKSKADEILNDIELIDDKVEQEIKQELSGCAEELDFLTYSLKEVNLYLITLKRLVQIYKSVEKAKIKMKEKDYYECSQLIKIAQDCMEINSELHHGIDLFKVLSEEVTLTHDLFIRDISDMWSNYVNINVNNNSVEKSQVTLSIQTSAMREITMILKASNHLKSDLIEKEFSEQLLSNILDKIVDRRTNLVVNTDAGDAVLSLEVFLNEERPNYLSVFDNLTKTIEFVKSNLDIGITENETFTSLVGKYIAQKFCENLVRNYLSKIIPNKSEDFNNFKNIAKKSELFEQFLHKIEFLPQESHLLLDYAENVNVLFANKFCQSFLSRARSIMKKDLHNVTKSEEVRSDISVLPGNYRNVLKKKMNIPDDLFVFPVCQISKHAKELITLMFSIMKEIEKNRELCSGQLFKTIRNIFEMYCSIVPVHNKKFLETLPQQVALFHNNCLYFSHHLIHVTTQLLGKSPDENDYTIFLEEAVVLRSQAAEKLEVTVTSQRDQITLILRESSFATLNENPHLDANAEKYIRQCMRQLQILQTVWKEVLPLHVYNRALGFLVDAVIDELISLIIAVEDISSQTCIDLETNFSIVLEKSPNLFSDEKEVYRHVRRWQKFKEFVVVIKGSLKDIDDRWANGMGPLALEFTAEEVKHLIRALFQNSDRRAALLARIR